MQIPKAIKAIEREREREPKAWTKHISKFPNPQNPKVDIKTQTDYLALKNSFHTREREREREREPSQTRSCYNHSEAILVRG